MQLVTAEFGAPDFFAEPRNRSGRRSSTPTFRANCTDCGEKGLWSGFVPSDLLFLVELPGIKPDALPGKMHPDLPVRYVSFQFSPVRYLRFRSRVLTASRRLTQVRAAGVSLSPEEIFEVFRVDKRAAADLNERQLFYSETLGQPSGLPALTASPRPRRYDPRSQAFSPCRGGDPGIRDSGHRHREPAPAERAAAAAILRG
jgi:hypothetical protein